MAVRQLEDDGLDFWARIYDLDFRQRRQRRSLTDLARELGIPETTIGYHARRIQLPPFAIGHRLAGLVGMEDTELLSFYRGDGASSNRITARELSSVGAAA